MTDFEIALCEATVGYDMDLSGCEFYEPEEGPLRDLKAMICDEPVRILKDLFPWATYYCGYATDECPLYAFIPGELLEEVTWPKKIEGAEVIFTLLGTGTVYETDRDCCCWGEVDEEGNWKPTGCTNGKPHPKCTRCDGHGSVLSPGGHWALYKYRTK
jgi:hypothetical protein